MKTVRIMPFPFYFRSWPEPLDYQLGDLPSVGARNRNLFGYVC